MTKNSNKYSLSDIACHLKLTPEGCGLVEKNASLPIRGISDPLQATEDKIIFIGRPKFVKMLEETNAKIVVISSKLSTNLQSISQSKQKKLILLTVPDAVVAFAHVSQLFQKEQYPKSCHPSAEIHPSAQLGKDVYIGPHTTIGENAKIGDSVIIQAGCSLGNNVEIGSQSILFPNVVLYDNCTIGKRVRIHSNVVMGFDGFGYASEMQDNKLTHIKIHHLGKIEIGDDVEMGANCTIARSTLKSTVIGRGTKISSQVHIDHNCHIGESVIICGKTGIAGSVKIGNNVIIGGGAAISNSVTIGEGATICGFTGVTGRIPPNTVWKGQVAREKNEFFSIQAALGHLPGMVKKYRKEIKKKDLK